MKRVCITGADGFLGRHLVDGLLAKGYEVYALVYPAHNIYAEDKRPGLSVYPIDLMKQNIQDIDVPQGIDVLFHLAWVGVRPEDRENQALQDSNIPMALSCMDFAKAKGMRKVIFPGSTNEYLYSGEPINENTAPSPSNAYGRAKEALRRLAWEKSLALGISFSYVVLSGIYAADRKDSNVIYYTIEKLLKREKPSLTKLEQLWDYVHIDDCVNALIAIAERGTRAFYAVGHGDNWPLSQYVETIHRIIDPNLPLGIGEVPYKDERLPSSCVDLTALKEDVGFTPAIPFEEGIKPIIEQVRKDLANA